MILASTTTSYRAAQRSHRRSRTIRGLTIACGILVAGIVIGSSVAHAQPVSDTVRLTLADATTRALTGGPELARARAEIERARAGRLLAGGFFPSLPELELERITDAPFHAEGEGEWEVGIRQEIELSGSYSLRRSAADAALAQTQLDARAVELAIRSDLRSAYVRAAAAEERLALVDSLTRFARRLDTIAGRLLSVGEISELERNSVRIERARNEMELVEARTELAAARTELARLAALPIGSVPVTSGIPTGSPSLLDTLASIERAFAAGDESLFARRPEMQALDRAAERVRIERSLASRRAVPNITLGLSLRSETMVLEGEDIEGSEVVRSGFERLRSTDRLLGLHLGVELPLPIMGLYDIGRGEVAAADAELAIIETERRLLAARLRAELVAAAARLRAAADLLTLYNSSIAPLVRRNLELLERGYTAGELTATELVTQQEQLLRTGLAAIDARREYAEAEGEVERAMGEGGAMREER